MAENEQNTPESEPGEGGNQRQAAEAAAYADTAASTQPEAAEGSEEPTPEALMAALEEDLNAARDAALRAQADAQNIKRRAEQDVEKARKFALESLTLKSFVDALRKFHIEPVDPEGQPFDPQLHQAMSLVENAEVEPNTVIAVMQKGYTLNSRLVRPAMVMVSKAPTGE